MRIRRRREKGEDWIKAVRPKLMEELIALLAKIIGESVKDKLVRAALIGALGAFGQYASDVAESVDLQSQEVVAQPILPLPPKDTDLQR